MWVWKREKCLFAGGGWWRTVLELIGKQVKRLLRVLQGPELVQEGLRVHREDGGSILAGSLGLCLKFPL